MNNVEFVSIGTSPLAKSFARSYNKPLHRLSIEHFADTETRIDAFDLELLREKNILLFFQISIDCHPGPGSGIQSSLVMNDNLFNLLLVVYQLKQITSGKLIVFLPYLPYSRQEKEADGGLEPIGGFVGKLFKAAGIDRLVVCDVHSPVVKQLMPISFFAQGLEHFWADIIKKEFNLEKNIAEWCIVSPDEGGKERAEKVAQLLGCAMAYVIKQRIDGDQSKALRLQGLVAHKKVIIIDDILDTGGTAINACKLLLMQGAKSVYGCFTHALLSSDACQKLSTSSFEKIYLTDTLLFDTSKVPHQCTVVSVHDFLIKQSDHILKTLIQGERYAQ